MAMEQFQHDPNLIVDCDDCPKEIYTGVPFAPSSGCERGTTTKDRLLVTYGLFKDQYGREQKPYEGMENMRKITPHELVFNEPLDENGSEFKFENVSVSIENHKDIKNIINEDSETIFAIVERGMVDINKNYVLSVGDIVRKDTIQKLSESFKINDYMKFIKIKKNENKQI